MCEGWDQPWRYDRTQAPAPPRHPNSLQSSALASKVPNFGNLQYLSLLDCPDEIWDFSSCSSLVNLRTSSLGDTVKQIVLPSGPEVMLQDLLVEMMPQDTHDYFMANISKATHLTKVSFMSAYPSNFRDGEWPLHLPNLCKLQLTGLSCDLPSAVTSCDICCDRYL